MSMGTEGINIPTKRKAANSNGSMSSSHLTISELREKNKDDTAANSRPRIFICGLGDGDVTFGVTTGELVDGVSDSITRFLSSSRSAIYMVSNVTHFVRPLARRSSGGTYLTRLGSDRDTGAYAYIRTSLIMIQLNSEKTYDGRAEPGSELLIHKPIY